MHYDGMGSTCAAGGLRDGQKTITAVEAADAAFAYELARSHVPPRAVKGYWCKETSRFRPYAKRDDVVEASRARAHGNVVERPRDRDRRDGRRQLNHVEHARVTLAAPRQGDGARQWGRAAAAVPRAVLCRPVRRREHVGRGRASRSRVRRHARRSCARSANARALVASSVVPSGVLEAGGAHPAAWRVPRGVRAEGGGASSSSCGRG